jgi:hypothetical protein
MEGGFMKTPQEAARYFSSKKIAEGYVPQALHVYTNLDGTPMYWRIRLKHSDGRKCIRPMYQDSNGKYQLGEPPELKDKPKPLYGLHLLSENSNARVWIVEGEYSADNLNDFFKQQGEGDKYIVITSGAATSAQAADWSHLAGRSCVCWPDNDKAGMTYAQQVYDKLVSLDCKVKIIDITTLKLLEKEDCVDWLKANSLATVETLESFSFMEHLQSDNNDEENDEKNAKQSQASVIVKFVQEYTELFHDKNKIVYAKDRITNEVRRLDGRPFHDWLVSSFYEITDKSPRDQSVREALSTLAGLGRYKGDCYNVHVRSAIYEEYYFLDLAEPGKSRAIRIGAGSWEIVNDPPVMFIRSESMCPLPEPKGGGKIDALWRIANIPENTQLLVLAWLCECLRPGTPFPVLELLGEQGSAKSTTQGALRQLIDPNTCNLRSMPKSVEDIFIGAGVSWLTSYENISHLSSPMQDALCVLATGGGFAKRKLYSDADESVINVHRPIVLNGISAAITAQDLIDRTLSIETPIITERFETTDLWKGFSASHEFFLGALLDIFAAALAILPKMKLAPQNRPRLIEFALLGMAVAEAMGKDSMEFMSQFQASRQESISRTIDASPVATAVVEWCQSNPFGSRCTAKEFMSKMDKYKPQHNEAWPRTPKGFADALRRAAPALRQIGIECRSLPKTGGEIRWIIESRENDSVVSPASPECPSVIEKQEQDIRTCRTSVPVFSSSQSRPPPSNGHMNKYENI